jgi:hypothetical protein
MSNYLKEIIAGKLPSPRPLRKGDELKEFYALFVEMVEAVKRRGRSEGGKYRYVKCPDGRRFLKLTLDISVR